MTKPQLYLAIRRQFKIACFTEIRDPKEALKLVCLSALLLRCSKISLSFFFPLSLSPSPSLSVCLCLSLSLSVSLCLSLSLSLSLCRLYLATYKTVIETMSLSEDRIMEFKIIAGYLNYKVHVHWVPVMHSSGQEGGCV